MRAGFSLLRKRGLVTARLELAQLGTGLLLFGGLLGCAPFLLAYEGCVI
jgi:hypothetical protein